MGGGGGFGGGDSGTGDGFDGDDEVAGGTSPVTLPTATASTTRTRADDVVDVDFTVEDEETDGATDAPPATRARHRKRF